MKFLLPVLIPSWRFFDIIAPSPRIEFMLLKSANDASDAWREFRPRPAKLSIGSMLRRLIWNPEWNESLFLVSCAERLLDTQDEHSSQEIVNRIRSSISEECSYLRFRIVLVSRFERQVAFISPVYGPTIS